MAPNPDPSRCHPPCIPVRQQAESTSIELCSVAYLATKPHCPESWLEDIGYSLNVPSYRVRAVYGTEGFPTALITYKRYPVSGLYSLLGAPAGIGAIQILMVGSDYHSFRVLTTHADTPQDDTRKLSFWVNEQNIHAQEMKRLAIRAKHGACTDRDMRSSISLLMTLPSQWSHSNLYTCRREHRSSRRSARKRAAQFTLIMTLVYTGAHVMLVHGGASWRL